MVFKFERNFSDQKNSFARTANGKGQLISEWLFDALNSKNKRKNLMNLSPRIQKLVKLEK